jgi:hypothetical protein
VAERGAEPPGVVRRRQEAGKIGGDIREGFVVLQVDGLYLQRLDAVLELGIIGWVPVPANTS